MALGNANNLGGGGGGVLNTPKEGNSDPLYINCVLVWGLRPVNILIAGLMSQTQVYMDFG